MVRSLLDPYPNVFISFPNARLFIQEIIPYKDIPLDGIVLNETSLQTINQKNFPLYLHLSDGYAFITKYKII